MVSLAKMLLVNISSIRNGVMRTFWAQKIALRKLSLFCLIFSDIKMLTFGLSFLLFIFYCYYCLKVIKHVNFVIFLKAIF